MSIRRLNPISRRALALTLATLMSAAPGSHRALAQDLDDAIDAELDEVAEGDLPSTDVGTGETEPAKTAAQSDADGLDDIQLDEGDEPTPSSQKAGAKSTAKAQAQDSNSDDAVIDDTLDLKEEEALDVAEPADIPQPEDDNVDLDGDNSQPAVAEKPKAQPAEELPIDDVAAEEPSPVVAEAPAAPVKRRPVKIDAANDSYERRLSQLSNGYKPVPDVNWDEIVGDRRQENYGIQRGDTLWDISETFFGDGFFWAKLWSQNGVIGNPHMIVRGKAIRFVAGTEGDAPAIGVMDTLVASNQEVVSINPLQETVNERPTYREQVEHEITPEEVESGVVLETDELIPAPELPPPSKRVPLLKELPSSFRAPVQATLGEGYDSSGVKGAPAIRAREPASSLLNSFIMDRQPNALGKIDEIETQDRVAHQGQAVYVRLNREVPAGTKVTFARVRPRPSGAAGPVIDIQGIGIIGESVNEGRNAYRATIIGGVQPVEKGASVFEFAPPSVMYTKEGRRNESQVTVVGGEYDDRRKLIGAGSVIYLAGGTNVGLRVGDIMGVEAVRGERRSTAYPKVKTPIALIKIADVQEKVATAVVLVSNQPVVVGDRTGGAVPESLPSLKSETTDDLRKGFSMNEIAPPAAAVQPAKGPQAVPSEGTDMEFEGEPDLPDNNQLDVPADVPSDDSSQMSDDLDATLDE